MNKEAYPHATEQDLGLLPGWVMEYNLLNPEGTLKDYLDQRYGFGLYHIEEHIKAWKETPEGEVLEDGTYRSPYDEDEDLQWVGKVQSKLGDVYFYPYAITAIPTDNGYFLTRMD